MDAAARIEEALEAAVARASSGRVPPRLSAAVRYAVFPGGARVRPRLCLAVAVAEGQRTPAGATAAAVAIELLHCASLVHDDLPCFDDADLRRGKPSVHKAFDEATAVLVGDALIVLAFDVVARSARDLGSGIGQVMGLIAEGVGLPGGIIAGQAWEGEAAVDLAAYHRAKTGALFIASVTAGAAAAGADPDQWRAFGATIGDTYQLADDLRDALGTAAEIGKPAGQDAAHGRPSAVADLGPSAAVAKFRASLTQIMDAIPVCPGREALQAAMAAEFGRFVPPALLKRVA